MKLLTLVRHAKSSWKHADLTDFDRPLNKRGKQDLPLLCERLIQYQLYPDQLIFSPATRTRLTAARIIDRLAIPSEQCQDNPEIYESSAETLLQVIQQVTDQTSHLMLVGHNPGLQDLGNYLLEGRSSVPH
ncbi:MAG: histidine phosphatase family protein, partial [Oceanospirillales bacterium]